jgi:hypothetical protein
MFRIMGRVQIAYVGLFLLACAGVFSYEAMFVWPVEKCESNGGWWSAKYRECATPIPVWRFTGRLPGEQSQPAAAAAKKS